MTLMKMFNIEYFSFRRFGTFLDTIHWLLHMKYLLDILLGLSTKYTYRKLCNYKQNEQNYVFCPRFSLSLAIFQLGPLIYPDFLL